MNELDAITGLIAIRTTVDTLDGLSQNSEEFSEDEREVLSEANDIISQWMDEEFAEADEE